MASRGASFDAIRLLLDDRLPPAPSIPTLLTLHAFRSKQMVKVKAHELRSKNKTELKKQLDELKKELAILRVWPFDRHCVTLFNIENEPPNHGRTTPGTRALHLAKCGGHSKSSRWGQLAGKSTVSRPSFRSRTGSS